MTKSLRAALSSFVALFVVTVATSAAQAIVVSSAPFSLGYGFSIVSGPIGGWQTTETAGANTPTVQGDFAFNALVTGGQFDSAGTGFTGRVHTSGGGYTGVSVAYSTEAGFQAVVTGAFTGALPGGSNFQTRVNVSEIRIKALAHPSFLIGDDDIAFSEVTPGNLGASAALPLTPNSGYTTAANYSTLSWNPTDFEEAGLTSTRTFVLLSDDLRAIDGFEIFGTVDLLYVALPEPTSVAMISLGTIGLLFGARRNRRGRA